MWVLDARANAEKVTYPVVWETKKDASNVIDYNIQEETTTDTSAVFNANNDTTTGMATVIPWVNAPKLKLSTSIYVDKLEIPSLLAVLDKSWVIQLPDSSSITFRNMNIIMEWGNENIVYYDSPKWILWSWMKIPAAWAYQIDAQYSGTWTPYSYSISYDIRWRLSMWWWSNDTILHTYNVPVGSNWESETFIINFNKWDILNIVYIMTITPEPSSRTQNAYLKFTIKKI